MTLPGEKIEIVRDEDGEIDWDWWTDLSEAEIEAIEKQSMDEYNGWWHSLTRLEQYRHMRAQRLESIKRQRYILETYPLLRNLPIFKRDQRISLLKAREFLKTGVYPVSDDD